MRSFGGGWSGDWRIYGAESRVLSQLRCAAHERSVRPVCLLVRRTNEFKFQGNAMVVIRLSRSGAKKRPFYNIVVADSHERRDGRFIERVGFYNPVAAGGEQPLRVATDRVAYWTGVGAQVSPTVARLIGQAKASA